MTAATDGSAGSSGRTRAAAGLLLAGSFATLAFGVALAKRR
jgi:hypothetical protein